MYIFRLTEDFLKFDCATSTGPLPGPNLVESPAFFKRKDTYYAFLGGCTCMGLYGGGVAVLTAKHPLGPCAAAAPTQLCPQGAAVRVLLLRLLRLPLLQGQMRPPASTPAAR